MDKKIAKDKKKEDDLNKKIHFLEEKWERTVKYTCVNCLNTAYDVVKENKKGYISDEDLIECSNYTLKHV